MTETHVTATIEAPDDFKEQIRQNLQQAADALDEWQVWIDTGDGSVNTGAFVTAETEKAAIEAATETVNTIIRSVADEPHAAEIGVRRLIT